MRWVLALFKQRWFITLIGFVALAGLIWVADPRLASEQSRIIIIASLIGLWAANRLRIYLLAKRDSNRLLEAILGPSRKSAGPTLPEGAEEEIATLKGRLQRALRVERRARPAGSSQGRRFFHQLPWYIVIGPPAVGKTTLLTTSSLRFLVEDERGRGREVKGSAGTRDCDWFFTDEAVLLDTAGRYLTQDASAAGADKAAWEGFLDLLRKHRGRRPINGALVAVSLPELLELPDPECQRIATDVRLRISELHGRLGIRFPIYLLFTKCDLMAGFVEFFAGTSEEEQDQVWGVTFPLSETSSAQGSTSILPWRRRRARRPVAVTPKPVEQVGSAFRRLEARLNQQVIPCLEAEPDIRRRSLIYEFPQQFCGVRGVAERFVKDAFEATSYETSPLLRGVYFTSGTQEGTPSDRLMASMAEAFRVDRQVLPTFSSTGQSYFVNRLLRDVVFPEQWLAATDPRRERRWLWTQRGVYAGTMALGALAIGAALLSYSRNQTYVKQVRAQTEEIQLQAQRLSPDQADLSSILAVLGAARAIPGGYADQQDRLLSLPGLGIGQREKLGSAAVEGYKNLLTELLLPPAVAALERALRQGHVDPVDRYRALRVYLMLGRPERFRQEAVTTWLKRTLGAGLGPDRQRELAMHLTVLFERGPVASIDLDETLVKRVRTSLTRSDPGDWVYAELMSRRDLWQDIPDFSVTEKAGRDVLFAFDIKQTMVPRQYTVRGYRGVFVGAVENTAGTLARDSWVMGSAWPVAQQDEELSNLKRALREHYFADYKDQWNNMLAAIDTAPFGSDLNKAIEVARLLSRDNHSPLQELLTEVARETTLDSGPGIPEAVAKKAHGLWSETKEGVGDFLGLPEDRDLHREDRSRNPVDRGFSALHAIVRPDDEEASPLAETLGLLAKVKGYLMSMEDADGTDWLTEARALGAGAVGELKRHAEHQPDPLRRWTQAFAQQVEQLTGNRALGYLNEVWRADVWQPYARKLRGRYPLVKGNSIGANLEDFGDFFGPGGQIDTFVDDYLKDIVDTRRWTVRSRSRVIPISPSTLAQLRRADEIKRNYFTGDGKNPAVHFWIKLLTMDRGVSTSTLDLDGQVVQFDTGPVRERELWWPGPGGAREARIALEPPSAVGADDEISRHGPWAWFRLLDQAQITPRAGRPDGFNVTFAVGGRHVSLELRASSAENPYMSSALRKFQCPESL